MPAITDLLRPDIAALEPYTPVVPIDVLAERLGIPAAQIIKLDANENPFGPTPRARAALADLAETAAGSPVAIYPDPEQSRLCAALSRYTGHPADQILTGAGSDELIDLIMRACLQPGDTMLDCPPTFGMYAFDAALYGARIVEVARTATFDLDVDAVVQAAREHHPRLLFVAAPNNPTGNPLAREAVQRLLALPLILVVDEAYHEFAGHTVVDLVPEHPNLVVLRTFSKWAGLAGLRVGYGMFHPELIGHLRKIKQPYTVNYAAEVAAIASLEDYDMMAPIIATLNRERARLATGIDAIDGLAAYPSSANFLLCRVARGTAGALRDALMRRGILVRHYRRPELRDCIRISIGTPAQNDAVLAALSAALAEAAA